jgi:phage terminase large subunit-like protein
MALTARDLVAMPPERRAKIIGSLTEAEARQLQYCWPFWARPDQLKPAGKWLVWLLLGGRGSGKTRTLCEAVCEAKRGGAMRIALVARTAADAREVIVEGESGMLACSPPWDKPRYEPSKRRLTWPNGAIATTYSADEPDSLRGPQHDFAGCDELASWPFAIAFDHLKFGLRLGKDPRIVAATTPRPTKVIKALVADALTHTTRVKTSANWANLAESFRVSIAAKYAGTRLGRQELDAEILEDLEGALWTHSGIDVDRVQVAPAMLRVVVAVDPATTSKSTSNETGIVVVGLGVDGHGYVLADHSGRYTPDRWAKEVVKAYDLYQADRVVAEVNNGGDMVEVLLRTVRESVPYKAVHATEGKRTRAEPVAALYEQHRVHHVGLHAKLEDTMCSWDPLTGKIAGDEGSRQQDRKDREAIDEIDSTSPDRLDALVWGLTDLQLNKINRRSERDDNSGAEERRPYDF